MNLTMESFILMMTMLQIIRTKDSHSSRKALQK